MDPIITNIIITAVLLLIIGLAVFYIIKAKKSGKKCIGCPDSAACSAKQNESSCCSGCGSCAYAHKCQSNNDTSSDS